MLAPLVLSLLLAATPDTPGAEARVDPFGLPQEPPLAVTPLEAEGHRPAVRVGPVLDDAALEDAVRSGLPLRLRFRVELWRDRWIDALAGSETWIAVLLYDPLEEVYLLRIQDANPVTRRFRTYAQASAAAEAVYRPSLVPSGRGRYYYRASLRIESLSLSDLDELRNWLRGDLAPAVGGDASVPRAIEDGMKRALIRLLGLPARIYEARSRIFPAR